MTIRVGWEGGTCGVQTYSGPNAVRDVLAQYPEIFPPRDFEEDLDENVTIQRMRERAVYADALGASRLVFEVTR